MAFAPDSVGFTYGDSSILGCFYEKDSDHLFEYSANKEEMTDEWEFPHLIWVSHNAVGMNNYRYGIVKKTVAYVAVDEDEFGLPVLEKWNLKMSRVYR
tara:strand:- start:2376 stop:2669 length:294 start_codon:yes stop_codon:yes gene_type:complete